VIIQRGKPQNAKPEHRVRLMMIHSDDRTIKVNDEDGGRTVRVEEPPGHVIFEGPVSTPAEAAQLPPDVRRQLDEIQLKIDSRLPEATREEEIRIVAPPRPARLI
jgi:hypothetical protein